MRACDGKKRRLRTGQEKRRTNRRRRSSGSQSLTGTLSPSTTTTLLPPLCRYMNGNPDALQDVASGELDAQYKELADCIRVVGFTDAQMNNLWALLAGILHAGEVEFAGDEEAYVVSGDDVVAKCTTNLGVVQDALVEALTTSINITRGASRRSCRESVSA